MSWWKFNTDFSSICTNIVLLTAIWIYLVNELGWDRKDNLKKCHLFLNWSIWKTVWKGWVIINFDILALDQYKNNLWNKLPHENFIAFEKMCVKEKTGMEKKKIKIIESQVLNINEYGACKALILCDINMQGKHIIVYLSSYSHKKLLWNYQFKSCKDTAFFFCWSIFWPIKKW